MLTLTTPIKLPPCINLKTLVVLERIARKRKAKTYTSKLSRGERAIARRRTPIPVSQWAEKHRIIHTSSRPGAWRNDVTRYTQGIMDASFLPGVRTIVLMKSPQTGGTEAIHNCVGYTIDRQPGPVLYVYPDEITARENFRDRVIPMINDSPRLRELLSPNPDDVSSLRVQLAHTTLYAAWSGSPSRLGNKPIRYLVLDELDKYQDSTKKEASSESLAEKRVTTWKEKARIWKISTPTTPEGPIARAFEDAQVRFAYSVRCPHCGKSLVMAEDGIKYPADMTPQDIFSRRAARYACPHCGTMWTDSDRDAAVRDGSWVERETMTPLEDWIRKERPAVIAFHVPAWLSPFVSLSEIAARLCEYEHTRDQKLLRDLCNNYRGEPWTERHDERKESDLMELCDNRPRGEVPAQLAPNRPRISCLLAGVDTQEAYFRYVVRAYGYGRDEESWLIQAGRCDTFKEMEDALIDGVFRDADGREYHVAALMIDAMGHHTREVYEWAARHRGRVYPWQGRRSMATPYATTALETFPGPKGEKIRIPGGLMLYRCDTTFFKSGLSQKLSIPADAPGAFHLHKDTMHDLRQYMQEMTAEVWDDRVQAWVNPGQRPNHYWDCEVMCSALAWIRNVRAIQRPGSRSQPVQRAPQPPIAGRTTRFRRTGRYG